MQGFVAGFRAGQGIENPVVVLVIVAVDIVVAEYRVATRHPSGVTVGVAADFPQSSEVAAVVPLFHFQNDIAETENPAGQQKITLGARLQELEGVGNRMVDKGMVSQPPLVNSQVVIPSIPVVGVGSDRDSST